MEELKKLTDEARGILQEGSNSPGYSLWINDVESLISETYGSPTLESFKHEIRRGGRGIRPGEKENLFRERMTRLIGFLERLATRGTRRPDSGPLTTSPDYSFGSISTNGIPAVLAHEIGELNFNLEAGKRYASALLIRRVITHSVFLAMQMKGKEALLKDSSGNELDLSKALKVCGNTLNIDSRIMGRVTSAKWIGDTANHSYTIKIDEVDIRTAVTGTSLFLRELFVD